MILKSHQVDLQVDLRGENHEKCDMCKQEKDEEEFAWRWKQLGIRGDTCRECKKDITKSISPARKRASLERIQMGDVPLTARQLAELFRFTGFGPLVDTNPLLKLQIDHLSLSLLSMYRSSDMLCDH